MRYFTRWANKNLCEIALARKIVFVTLNPTRKFKRAFRTGPSRVLVDSFEFWVGFEPLFPCLSGLFTLFFSRRCRLS